MGDVSCARRTFVKAVPAIGAAVTATTVWGHPLHAVADEGTKGKIVEPEMNELEFDFVSTVPLKAVRPPLTAP